MLTNHQSGLTYWRWSDLLSNFQHTGYSGKCVYISWSDQVL